MKQAKIAILKNNLSRYLAHVRGGGSVLVLDRDRPVARLVPLPSSDARGASERLAPPGRCGGCRAGEWRAGRGGARVGRGDGGGCGGGRKDSFPTRGDGRREPGWSPAAVEQRPRAAWS